MTLIVQSNNDSRHRIEVSADWVQDFVTVGISGAELENHATPLALYFHLKAAVKVSQCVGNRPSDHSHLGKKANKDQFLQDDYVWTRRTHLPFCARSQIGNSNVLRVLLQQESAWEVLAVLSKNWTVRFLPVQSTEVPAEFFHKVEQLTTSVSGSFNLLFAMNAVTCHGYKILSKLNTDSFEELFKRGVNEDKLCGALFQLADLLSKETDPSLLSVDDFCQTAFSDRNQDRLKQCASYNNANQVGNGYLVRCLKITPTRVVVLKSELTESNRILRRFKVESLFETRIMAN